MSSALGLRAVLLLVLRGSAAGAARTISSGSSTLSITLRQGSRFGFWNAMPAIFTGPRTLSPKMTMSPESGGTSPVTSFINDDLPQPDGPTTAANSPRRTFSVVPFSASTPPDAPL